MWKKIHSNRNPKDTLYSELHREFGVYFRAAEQDVRQLIRGKPKWAFGVMTLLLAGSVILSFTIFRQHSDTRKTSAPMEPVSAGFHQLMNTTAKIGETIRLKRLIDSLSLKPNLTLADSTKLGQALDSLAVLQQSLIHSQHEH